MRRRSSGGETAPGGAEAAAGSGAGGSAASGACSNSTCSSSEGSRGSAGEASGGPHEALYLSQGPEGPCCRRRLLQSAMVL